VFIFLQKDKQMNIFKKVIKNKGNQTLAAKSFYILCLGGAIVWALFPPQVLANGALPYCLGAKMCQMGGAGVAVPLDATSGNVNPALMAKVANEIDLQPIIVFQKESVNTSHSHITEGTPFPPHRGPLTNKIKAYAAGYSGINYNINSQWTFGITTAGGGNNARYKRSLISPDLHAPRKLRSMAGLLSQILAYKPACNQAYGLSLIGGYFQTKNNLTQFPSGTVTRGANKLDWALGIGARMGGQWDLGDILSIGLAASSPIFFQKLKKYDDVLKRRPRLPPIVTAGLAWHIRKDIDILFDLEGLFWRKSPIFGKTPPIGQRWKNVLVFKVGAQQKIDEKLMVRAGYNFGKSPIPKNEVLFNALSEVITVTEQVVSAGVTYNVTEAANLDVGLAHMFTNSITDNGKGVAGSRAKGMKVKARGFVLTLGFNLKY
jgi:long-chain fatty acid transport protein